LLEVEGPGDVDIVKAELRYILCSCFIFIFFSHIFLLLYSCENWIDLNRISLPLYLNIKPQIGLYISTLGSLYSCTILTFQYQHPRALKFYQGLWFASLGFMICISLGFMVCIWIEFGNQFGLEWIEFLLRYYC
jgi:hypothetical protein